MKRSKLGIGLLCLSLFFLALLKSFPFQNLRGLIFGKLYAATKILVVSDDLSLAIFGWPGLKLKNVNVTLPLGNSELELSSLYMAVRLAGISSFIPFVPSLSLEFGELSKGGDLYIKVGQTPKNINLYLDARKVALEQINVQGGSDIVKGNANIESDLALDLEELSKSTGYLDLKLSEIKLAAQTVGSPDPAMAAFSFVIPAMRVDSLSGKLNIKNGVVEFNQFKFGEASSDLKGSINGDIRLGKTYQQSVVNLSLKIQLSQAILDNPQAKTFVTFLDSYRLNPGEYGMRWNASIQEFMGLSIKVLPEKLTN